MTTTNTTTKTASEIVESALKHLSRETRLAIEAHIRQQVDTNTKAGVEAGLANKTKALVSEITARLTGTTEDPKKGKAAKKEKKEKTEKAKREINRGVTEDGDSYSEWIRKYDSENPGENGKGVPAKTVLEKAKEKGLTIKDDKGFLHLVYNVRKNVRKGSQKEAAK